MAFNFRKSFGWNKPKETSESPNPRWSGRRDNFNTSGINRAPSNPTFSPFGRGFSKSKPVPPTTAPTPTPPNNRNGFGSPWSNSNNSWNQGNTSNNNNSPFGKTSPTPTPSFGNSQLAAPKEVKTTNLPQANLASREPVNGRKNKALALFALIFAIAAVIGVFSAAAAIEAAKPPEGIQLFPAETRSGNDFIGILFLEPKPDEQAGQAFIDAARRWSEILRGSERLLNGNEQVQAVCGQTFPEPVSVDHLRIFSVIRPDSPGGRLASAGPCRTQGNTASFGSMDFDELDIPGLVARNQLEDVVLHEMGHVLGIGTFWNRFNIIINSLPGGNPNLALPQPEYTGQEGIAGFGQIGGQGPLFIENGFTNNRDNGARAGSTNGHFDQDSAQNELMTFQISNRGSPLSLLTARSLRDLGLTVDLSRVDAFNLNNVVLDGPQDEEDGPILHGDILDLEIEES